MLIGVALSVGWEMGWDRMNNLKKQSVLSDVRGSREALLAGLERSLPVVLIVTFVLVPNTATRIFETFLCDPLEYDEVSAKSNRFLHDDLYISCDSEEYQTARTTALAMLVVWPVGTPLLYIALLWASSGALQAGSPTPLSRATAFLSDDYNPSEFWWEPLEMCRKLALTVPPWDSNYGLQHLQRIYPFFILWQGWVLLIGEMSEQARVLCALLVSVAFLTLSSIILSIILYNGDSISSKILEPRSPLRAAD
eukprot:89040-Prymnesium_polylepis.4